MGDKIRVRVTILLEVDKDAWNEEFNAADNAAMIRETVKSSVVAAAESDWTNHPSVEVIDWL